MRVVAAGEMQTYPNILVILMRVLSKLPVYNFINYAWVFYGSVYSYVGLVIVRIDLKKVLKTHMASWNFCLVYNCAVIT